MAFSRKDAVERRAKTHREIPFAPDESLRATLSWEDPYWKMVSEVSAHPVGADAFQTALAFAKLIKEGGGDAWIYEFGIPGLLTHAVCIVKASGRWWVEDPFFNTAFKAAFSEVLEQLEAGEIPERGPEASDRICLVNAQSPSAAEAALINHASRELTALGAVRRLVVQLSRDGRAALLDDPRALLEALSDYELAPTFDSLMLLPLRAVADGRISELGGLPGGAGLWLTARTTSPTFRDREITAQERRLARLARRGRERALEFKAEAARLEKSASETESRINEIAAELHGAKRGAQAAQALLTAAESAAADLREELEAERVRAAELEEKAARAEAGALGKREAQDQAAAARAEAEQLQRRLGQLQTSADEAARELALSQEFLAAAAATGSDLQQALDAERERAAELAARVTQAEADMTLAGAEVQQLEQRLIQLRASEEDSAREAAAAGDLLKKAEEAEAEARQELDAERARSVGLEARAEKDQARLGRAEEDLAITRARALAAIQQVAGAELKLTQMGQALERTQGQGALERAQSLTEQASLQGELLELQAARRSLDLANEAAVARETELVEQLLGMRTRMGELENVRRSLELANEAAAEREIELAQRTTRLQEEVATLDAEGHGLRVRLEETQRRERLLIKETVNLQGRLLDLEGCHRAIGESLRDVTAREEEGRAEREIKERLLGNLARYAARIGGLPAETTDPFDALDRLHELLGSAQAEQASLTAQLSNWETQRDRTWPSGVRRLVRRMLPPRRRALGQDDAAPHLSEADS